MNWLNLQVSIIRAPKYVGSEPVARATWLNVMTYCAEHENGGRIVGARTWKDRQWQQTCGVTLEEVNGSTQLLAWDEGDLVAWNGAQIMEDSLAHSERERRRAGIIPWKNRRLQRMRKARLLGTHTAEEWEDKLTSLGRRCLNCGATERIQKDHIQAVADGGSDGIDNLQPLCRSCNSSKGARTINYMGGIN